ncbi:MAG TPA: tRNA 2-selenouridine(34) synthase MnmH [Tenuifilaceae bacterium]|nr:tRNA 2-selenouridine(34) synthase MnmH [Tenuifilaceae bacterium]HPE17102.1 tRNA 2-selenouridine(34) synthase MnmH [Tenuifilaceae bacterium]HPJ44828.1 tRNA 2-selenouridine(34) synthase MnmH [Tenuifilaceae bacterium]HPQ32878.1 tRNA 2-selenouridine(34) synthase MnmH [Tenuifilaceae bacterium]HRX67193.1 tRNA 2-selenouridine(34) synthase MnmH [Tenuifilaceae bacterium]
MNSLRISIDKFLEFRSSIPVVDVRSPGEYHRGHIPGAVNIPLFNDDERAEVGTIYKQKGRLSAIHRGLDIIGPQMSEKVRLAHEVACNNKLMVYCWRGGMRSSSMSWLFNQVGIETRVLVGGYKSFRRTAQKQFELPFKIIVLGGMTGSGKTAILNELVSMDEQVIDLEGLAHHKGSAFGGIGQQKQPTTEHFENKLFDELFKIDTNQWLWLEDESHSIGSVFIPLPLFQQMRQAKTIAIERPFSVRVDRLVEEYAYFPPNELSQAVSRITKRLGGDNAKVSLESIERGDYRKAIEICLKYYDKTYQYGLDKRDVKPTTIQLDEDDPTENAKKLIQLVYEQ